MFPRRKGLRDPQQKSGAMTCQICTLIRGGTIKAFNDIFVLLFPTNKIYIIQKGTAECINNAQCSIGNSPNKSNASFTRGQCNKTLD